MTSPDAPSNGAPDPSPDPSPDPPVDRFARSMQAAGVKRVPAPGAAESAAAAEAAGDARATLDALAEEICACTACPLADTRSKAVPGEGSPTARVVFVGEGPGADEDRTGRPFVGRAGKLLDDIITKGMKLQREDVYICNVVKCRPPGNRVPESGEVAACSPYLERQLAALQPAVICALGATACRRLLDTDESMGRLRGNTYEAYGFPVIPTYHPAYLLRNPAAKKATWEDIQRVMKLAGLT